ncbi:DUF6575 domain-containing protein [Butyrivibrio sp. YAB3001]|uniref:DUF6575 domain-containing protein n=1 Tax=Butyrivibrio sp. YAB3001 TaxID=1520812 RepID=UPI0008F68472|nr:DUF6575 domain-containing protein [Butyrivibrio sp. YAB3001]SFC94128.1 hypothetical protein SAMN02910398_03569 [Butyrivibrio sp. YAB3001]
MFEKFKFLGKMSIERVLFSFENEPIVFICKNKSGIRYICINTGYGYEPSWLLARSSKRTIIKMLRDEISVLEAMAESLYDIVFIHETEGEIRCERLPFTSIDEKELPDANEKLQNGNISDYIQQLENEEISKDYVCSRKEKMIINEVFTAPESSIIDYDNYCKSKKMGQIKSFIEYAEG